MEPAQFLLQQQGELRAFLALMEGIRWKFLGGFGVGASIGVFITLALGRTAELQHDVELITIGTVLSLLLSFSGLLIQIRVYCIICYLWNRIIELQGELARLMLADGLAQEIAPRVILPYVTLDREDRPHFFTVHFCCSLVLASLAATSLALFSHYFPFLDWLSSPLVGLVAFIAIMAGVYFYTATCKRRYDRSVDIYRSWLERAGSNSCLLQSNRASW